MDLILWIFSIITHQVLGGPKLHGRRALEIICLPLLPSTKIHQLEHTTIEDKPNFVEHEQKNKLISHSSDILSDP